MLARQRYADTMTEVDLTRFRNHAEECRKRADGARSQADREAWLQLAADWTKLAESGQEQAPSPKAFRVSASARGCTERQDAYPPSNSTK